MASGGAEVDARLPGEWAELELAVRRLLDEHDRLRARAARAEERTAELETTLREYSSGSVHPADLQRRLEGLERENQDLRTRLEKARERVGRVMERLRFAGESR